MKKPKETVQENAEAHLSTAADISAGDIPSKPPAVIDGLLGRGETMNIIGPFDSGKTRLAIDLALCIAGGSPWLGFNCTQGKALFIQIDHKDRTLKRFLLDGMAARGIDRHDPMLKNLTVMDARVEFYEPGGLMRCLAGAANVDADVVIFDSFSSLMLGKADMNNRQTVLEAHDILSEYADNHDCAIVLLQDRSVDESEELVEDIGCSLTAATADTNLILTRTADRNTHKVTFRTKSFKEPKPVVFDKTEHTWTPLDNQK